MNIKSKIYILIAVFCSGLIFFPAGNVFAETYNGLKGVKAVKAVWDVRVASPKVASIHLGLMHKTFKDSSINTLAEKPEFVIIFMGHAVKLISKDRKGFSPEDQQYLDKIADIISAMEKDGIKLEVCVAAANLLGVVTASLFPEIEQVGNGWISAIGYQLNGYALISDF